MIDTPFVPISLPQLARIEEKLDTVLEGRTPQGWFRLNQAHRRKYGDGGLSLQVVRNTLALQPRGGIPDGWISSRKAWRAETIDAWIDVDDLHLAGYLAACGSTAKVPARIVEANEKHIRDYPSLAGVAL